jgi:hypothetical protein
MPIVTRGPFFDSRRTRFTDEFCEDLMIDVVETAQANWVTNMKRTFEQPTPRYWHTPRVEVFPTGDIHAAVTNDGGRLGGPIYGPWLEGVNKYGVPHGGGKRGGRFKGYWNLRKARQETARQVRRIAAPALRRYYGRMNRG